MVTVLVNDPCDPVGFPGGVTTSVPPENAVDPGLVDAAEASLRAIPGVRDVENLR